MRRFGAGDLRRVEAESEEVGLRDFLGEKSQEQEERECLNRGGEGGEAMVMHMLHKFVTAMYGWMDRSIVPALLAPSLLLPVFASPRSESG